MASGEEPATRRPAVIATLVLAALAYVPALTASPGRMVADSKLYLYLDPGRFLADNLATFDPRQFAGWVPHQHISYLWPSGPYYWLLETLGVSDWIAHRLWVGTLLLVGGLGARWVGRLLGLSATAALIAAIVYQLAPYVLPYVSRTSVMLLPFAGLGWIVGLTILATRRGGWAPPAGIALIVLTVGAVNATALLMIVPGPVLWLVHAAWGRAISTRDAVVIALRTGLLCLGASAWWIAMLLIQGRHGADVLSFSEALEDVALTSTGAEVQRGLGYWLFYVRDAFGPTTSASFDYLVSTRLVLVGYTLTAVCAAGLVFVRWVHRRFAALLVGTGVVLAVGLHPTDDPPPLLSLLTGGGESALAEALRSSTRALPLVALGLGLAAASLADGASTWRLSLPARASAGRRRPAAGVGGRTLLGGSIVLLAVLNLPALWTGGFTDPILDRDENPPSSWEEAADALDALPPGSRVLQLPGAEFGAFRWGYTVDQPLPGLTDRPLVTRDLLPLGSPAAMDLVFALDDRVQEGVLDPDTIAPVARLLGADVIWAANDAEFERFRTARPELVARDLDTALDIDLLAAFGTPQPNTPEREMLDETALVDPAVGQPIPPVELWRVSEPVPIIRAAGETLYVSGSGDGLVDAAAELRSDSVVRYSASTDPTELIAAAEAGAPLLVTDSNRDRAHHWRSSQDVVGMTEEGGPGEGVLVEVVGDERLDVFGLGDDVPEAAQTVAIQQGPVQAAASAYGEAFAYRPEHRAAMAVDGDPETSWLVGDRADARGEFIELTVAGQVSELLVRQPDPPADGRVITAVDLSVDDASGVTEFPVELDDSSLRAPGQRIPLPDTVTDPVLRLTITETSVPARLTPETLAAVGFAEIDVGLGPTLEWIRPPVDAIDAIDAASGDEAEWEGITTVLTRHRADPLDRWRDDPEPALRRLVPAVAWPTEAEQQGSVESSDAVTPAAVEVELRLNARVDDDTLVDIVGLRSPSARWAIASDRLVGAPGAWGMAAVDGDLTTAWRSPFGDPVDHTITVHHGAPAVTEFDLIQPPAPRSTITSIEITSSEITSSEIAVPPPDDAGRSRITLPEAIPGPALELRVTAVDETTTIDPRYGEITAVPSGIAEIEIPDALPPAQPTDLVEATCRDDLLAVDDRSIGLSYAVPTADFLDGDAFPARVCTSVADGDPDDGDPGDGDTDDGDTDDAVRLASTPGHSTGVDVDRVTLRTGSALDAVVSDEGAMRPQATVVDSDRLSRTVAIDNCSDGCWVVLGEGYNTAWKATLDGEDLGDPELVDGGFNGWRIPAGADGRTVSISWTAQTPLNWAFAITITTIITCLTLIAVAARRRRSDENLDSSRDAGGNGRRALPVKPPVTGIDASRAGVRDTIAVSGAWILASGLLVDWVWALVALGGSLVLAFHRRLWTLALAGWVGVVGVGVAMAVLQRDRRPFPNGGWPGEFSELHEISVFAIVTLVVGAAVHARGTARPSPTIGDP